MAELLQRRGISQPAQIIIGKKVKTFFLAISILSLQVMNQKIYTTSNRESQLEIQTGIMRGNLKAPPSKSISHRYLLLAALSQQPCIIQNVLISEDILVTLDALRLMGFAWEKQFNDISFFGKREQPADQVTINLGNSGTSARLLIAMAAALPGNYLFTGSPRMLERPMLPLIEALSQLGVQIQHENGFLPVQVEGGLIKGGEVQVDTSLSSQFLSALMILAPLTRDGLHISTSGTPVSQSYIQLTRSILEKTGIKIEEKEESITIRGQQKFIIDRFEVEGDFSSASYFAVGAAISDGSITIDKLNPESLQGDHIILDILSTAGAKVQWKNRQVQVEAGTLNGIDRNLNSQPDLVPTLAIMALFGKGSSRLREIQHLRFKETDRLEALINNIRKLGGNILLERDDLIINPVPLHGAFIPTFNDHRIAMSFALAGLRVPGIKIENPGCVDKSFPEFWDFFQSFTKNS